MCHLWVTNLGSYCEKGDLYLPQVLLYKASCLLRHKTQDHPVATTN